MLTIIFSYFVNARWASKWIAPWWGKLIIFVSLSKVKVKGLENLDTNQSYIVVCNHQSTYDTLTVYGYFPGEFKWVLKKELEKVPFVGASCKALGHVFVDRKNSELARQSLMDSKSRISNGVSAFFFPEGTRSPNGELINFKKGAFRMAKMLELPILPVTISGARKIMPAKSFMICPNTISMTISEAISIETVNNMTVNQLSRRAKEQIAANLSIN